jgi:hypothetical protein
MSFFLSPIGNSQQFNANGDPLNGGKIYTYLAGSTTPAATYTSITGATPQANPIILNTLGVPASPIWMTGGIALKFVIKDPADVTLQTIDNVTGVNDTTSAQTEWVSSGFVPTFISATSFSVPGDQTGILEIGRRIRTSNTAGTIYSTITNSVFGAGITTVTVVNDSGVLDSGLSVVSYGVSSAVTPSLPNSVAVRNTMGITAARQSQEGIAYTTAGTSTAYTLTPVPAITAYVANQSFFVNFNAASGAAPTLAISGVATPPNLVKQNVDGTYSNIAANDIPVNHRSRVTLLSATQALVERLPIGGPTFSAYLSADQSLTSGVAAKILFNTEDFDTNSYFASSRFTPLVAGYYQVNSNCGLAVASGWSAGFASLYKNGAEYERGAQLNTTGVTLFGSTYTGVVAMNGSTDYIEMYAAITGTTPVVAGGASRISKFSATFLRGL